MQLHLQIQILHKFLFVSVYPEMWGFEITITYFQSKHTRPYKISDAMSRTTIHVCIVVPRRYDNQQQYIAHTGFVSLPVDHAHLGNSNDARICERIHITRRSHEVKWSIQESTQHDQDTPYLSPPYTTMRLRDITSYSVSQLLCCLGETCHQFSKGSVAVELSQNMASVHARVSNPED